MSMVDFLREQPGNTVMYMVDMNVPSDEHKHKKKIAVTEGWSAQEEM